ncbi:MAG: tetratricopeptide repeat protein, partial [Endomicrobium sp.]|nr:tetratricopeptide repeat protein [Endomicrobium sp.]
MKCKKCNAVIEKNVKFCPECGAKIEENPICSKCGAKLDKNTKFCPECGTKSGKNVETAIVSAEVVRTIDSIEAPKGENPKVRGHIDKANKFGDKEKFDKSITEFTLALEIQPNNVEALFGRGCAYLYSEQSKNARIDLKKAIRLMESDNNKALVMFDDLKEQFPKINDRNEKIGAVLSWAYCILGMTYPQEEKTIAALEKSIEYCDSNALTYQMFGKCYFATGNHDEAEENFEQAIALDPKLEDSIEEFKNTTGENPKVREHIDKAKKFRGKEKHDKSITELTLALEIQPNNVETLMYRSVEYNHIGQPKNARIDIKKAIRLMESDNNKALVMFDDLKEEFPKINDRNEKIGAVLSFAYHILGITYPHEEKGIAALEKSIEYCDSNAEAYQMLGYLYFSAGNHDEAEENFEQAIALNPKLEDSIEEFKKSIVANATTLQYDEETGILTCKCPYCGDVNSFSPSGIDGDTIISWGKLFLKGALNPVEGISKGIRALFGGDDTEYAITGKCDSCEKKVVLCKTC